MAIPVLILGASGSGKSASLRNFDNKEYALINVMGKPLPFSNSKKFLTTTDYGQIKQALLDYSTKTKVVVIDDAGYLITEQFMSNHSSNAKGNEVFALYNRLADDFYKFLRFIAIELPQDMIVVVTMHDDRDDLGYVKPKTIGKMLDEKVNVAGLFTIIFHAVKQDGQYVFRTQSDGYDVTKAPMNMFDSDTITNDLQLAVRTIQKFYKIGEPTNEQDQ